MDGKERLYSIGIYSNNSLAQTRKCKDVARASVAAGIDPCEAKQEEKRIRKEAKRQSFEMIGAAFLAKQRKEGKSKATLDKTEYHLRTATLATNRYQR
ncbi:MAG: integrase arm-type DNA-binding domain-containing protein [Pseudomonadota bacterium]